MNQRGESMSFAAGCLNDAIVSALDQADRTLRAVAIAQVTRTVDPDQLVTMLGDGEHATRRNAAIAALTQGGSRSVPALIRALRDPDAEVVLFAVGVLGKSRDPAAIPHLVSMIDHSEINVAQAAIDSLSQLRPTVAVDALIRVLDRDPWLRFAAIHALGEIGDARAVRYLLPLVADEAVRDVAIEALGKIGTVDVLPTLASLLRDAEDSMMFGVCLRAIGELLANNPDADSLRHVAEWAKLASGASAALEERLREVLSPEETDLGGDPDAVAAKGAAASLVRALRLRPLYASLVLAGRHPMLRELLQFCVVSIGGDIAPFLGMGLEHLNSNVVVVACRSVGAMGLRQFAPKLVTLLSHDVSEVRLVAAEALGAMRESSSVVGLAKLLGDEIEDVRQAARAALALMDAEAATTALLSVKGEEVAVCGAIEVMRQNPNPRQLPFLRGALGDSRSEVRYAAVNALGAQPNRDLPKVLAPLLTDPVQRVRRAAVGAIARTREPRASELLLAQIERDPSTRVEAILALAKMGDAAVVPHLIEIFDRELQPTRLVIIEVLAELKQPAAEPMLVRLLADPSAATRHAAVRALVRFGSAAAMRHLVAAARDDDANVRGLVAGALPLNDPNARAALERLCMDANGRVASVARSRLDAQRDAAPV
jgi:HEAT repeat protein